LSGFFSPRDSLAQYGDKPEKEGGGGGRKERQKGDCGNLLYADNDPREKKTASLRSGLFAGAGAAEFF